MQTVCTVRRRRSKELHVHHVSRVHLRSLVSPPDRFSRRASARYPRTASSTTSATISRLCKRLLEREVDVAAIEKNVDLLVEAYNNDRRVVLCGNGGSASTASHLVCDLMKIIFLEGGKPFEVVALTDSPALISAWGNDTHFEHIFAGQAKHLAATRAMSLIGISGSGNSKNILNAVDVAAKSARRVSAGAATAAAN